MNHYTLEQQGCNKTLFQLGWNQTLEENLSQTASTNYKLGRVNHRNRNIYHLLSDEGQLVASLSGKYQYEHEQSLFPVVGDWVLYENKGGHGVICGLVPRKSKFSRKEAGVLTNEQVLAANVDIVFIVTGLDSNFNLSRIMRYKTVVMEGGARPVILLNKSDLCDDLEDKIAAVRALTSDDPIHAVSSYTEEGLDAVKSYLTEGVTVAFFGSSGVGKSSLTNALLKESAMTTSHVSEAHGKGRHTTTTAELMLMPEGGMLIDTPGIREIQIWCHEDAIDAGFEDIALLAADCKFENCNHRAEPGCAIKKALKTGILDQRHYQNYQNLKREAIFIEQKQRHKDRISNKPDVKKRPRQKKFDATLD